MNPFCVKHLEPIGRESHEYPLRSTVNAPKSNAPIQKVTGGGRTTSSLYSWLTALGRAYVTARDAARIRVKTMQFCTWHESTEKATSMITHMVKSEG